MVNNMILLLAWDSLSICFGSIPDYTTLIISAHLSSYSADGADLAAADLLAACLGGTDDLLSLLFSLEEYLLLS